MATNKIILRPLFFIIDSFSLTTITFTFILFAQNKSNKKTYLTAAAFVYKNPVVVIDLAAVGWYSIFRFD